MKKIFAVVTLLITLLFSLTNMANAMAQISLQNNTKYTLKLYIDGNFGCGPVLPRGFCTSSVTAGSHYLDAKKGDEIIQHEEGVQIGDGTSPTWTVTIEESPTLEGQWMIQSSSVKNDVGTYRTFTGNGDGYISDKKCPITYYGGPTEYTGSFTADYNCLLSLYGTSPDEPFAKILQKLAGKITFNERITLSPDGNTATRTIDNFRIITDSSPRDDVFQRIETRPPTTSILVRISLRP
jgi:hypothetical protein